MKIAISRSFVKDTQKINNKRILANIQQVLLEAEQIESLSSLSNLEELSGFSGYYRIKLDYRYRIGLYYQQDSIQFLRVGSRENFYKKFP